MRLPHTSCPVLPDRAFLLRHFPSPFTNSAFSMGGPVKCPVRFRKTALFQNTPVTRPPTFHARSRFPGRSCVFSGDLPCQRPFSWKVLPFPRGPSMPGAVFLEGAVVRTVLVILLYDFLLRVQSNLAVFDLTLLRFFKSKISGPRRVWGIRSPGNLVRLGPQ